MAWSNFGARVLLGAHLAASILLAPRSSRVDVTRRLEQIPRSGLPLRAAVTVHWNRHQVPFIEAGHDDDAATALGLVHAHLRLGQMELLRRASQGRLSEMLGPIAFDFDYALRILDPGRAVTAIIEGLPDQTRRWVECYVQGVNAHLSAAARLPHEFAVFGLKREPWTLRDVFALGRFMSADVTWFNWLQLLGLRGEENWPQIWQRLCRHSRPPPAGLATRALHDLRPLDAIAEIGRRGSNAIAVAAQRSAGGGAIVASDPHLPITIPNPWLIVGYVSPSFHTVGLMLPGLPFVALGRNQRIAWGSTSLHASNSELFDVSELRPDEIAMRETTIRIRWRRDRRVTVRETRYGPIISDAPFPGLMRGGPVALHWIGHVASDEITAMLRLNQARDWYEFRTALAGFSVPGMTMLYADVGGHIGKTFATRLPRGGVPPARDIIAPSSDDRRWADLANGAELPSTIDPASGIIVSANERPIEIGYEIGRFFSPADRAVRIAALLGEQRMLSAEDIKPIFNDAVMANSLAIRDRLSAACGWARRAAAGTAARRRVVALLLEWDGRYSAGSAGALVFEFMLDRVVRALCDETTLAAYAATWEPRTHILADLANDNPSHLNPVVEDALDFAAAALVRHGSWGAVHRLVLAHPLAQAPLIGRRYRFADLPADGGAETIMKSAHGFVSGAHASRYGSNARHISDLSDPDCNDFVLLGGQDGWLGSSTLLDQVELWRQGRYVRVPLRIESVRAQFEHRTELRP